MPAVTVARFSTAELHDLLLFGGLPDDQLAWIAAHSDRVDVPKGQRLISRGDPADHMFVVVDGIIQRFEEIGGQWLIVATTRRGEVTGMLPFSRMTHYPGHMIAAEPTRILRLDRRHFVEMLAVSTALGQRLVAQMSDRVRGDVRLEQQREKMLALGRLSAGLAHELNNPAAAAGRVAEALSAELDALDSVVASLVRHQPDATTMQRIGELARRAREQEPLTLPAMDRSEREEELSDWLENRAVPQAWDIAGVFVDAGLTVADLDHFAASVSEDVVADAIAWVGCGLSARRMATQITSATTRIAQLIASVKTYSHMDRSAEHKPTDVREGLDHTLVMLGHRLGAGGVTLTRDYPEGLPSIPAHAGELNQVWTTLIDNALDALGHGGQLRVDVRVDGPWVAVDVIDNGPGIPEGIRHRVFEPFFTTKDVGEGTGLSLDIAQRIVTTHQGQIEVQSRPGRTVFRVRLPVSPRSLAGPGAASA